MNREFMDSLIKKSDLTNKNYNENNLIEEKPKKFLLKYKKLSNPTFSDYIVLDFETTGFSPKENKIIEIGAIKVINNKTVKSFSTLINPKVDIPPYISSKIKITDLMVKDMPVIETVFPHFIKFLGNYPLVIHNAKFDMGFLIENACNLNFNIENSAFDTVYGTKALFPKLKKYNLKFLCEYFEIENKNAHRAMSDASATYFLYEILRKNYLKINNTV